MGTTASTNGTPGSGEQLLDIKYGLTWDLPDSSDAEAHFNAGVWNYKNLTASGTTVVKTGPGQLHAVLTGTATGNITIYDNTAASGTVIYATSALGPVGSLTFDLSFITGLTIVLSGAGTATVTYL